MKQQSLPLLLSLLFLLSCASARIDLPADAWTVEGANPRWWNRPLAFGPYRTATVREGTQRSWIADLGIVELRKADQGYRMTLGDVSVECHTREVYVGRSGFFIDANLEREPILVCGYDDAGTRSLLALSRTGRMEPTLRGELRATEGGPSYEVRSVHRVPGSAFPSGEPHGFELLRDGRRVAAVETVNRGRVWIDPTPPTATPSPRPRRRCCCSRSRSRSGSGNGRDHNSLHRPSTRGVAQCAYSAMINAMSDGDVRRALRSITAAPSMERNQARKP